MDGVLLVDKPILWTSHDVVDYVRRLIGQKKVGHAGTLDPMATGLLVILVGRATKLSGSLTECDKEYRGSMHLGLRTDTQDLEGRIVETADYEGVTPARLEELFRSFQGNLEQKPPIYSAVRQGGRKLYEYSRRGDTVDIASRPISIRSMSLDALELPEVYFTVACSKGTYVRSLCEDIGQRLGIGATLSALVRTRSGSFRLGDAISLKNLASLNREQIEKRLVLKSDAAHETIR